MKGKLIIYRRPSYRYTGIKEAAAALGVTKTAIALYLGGRPETLGPAKRRRIVVKTLPAKDRAVPRVSRIDTDC